MRFQNLKRVLTAFLAFSLICCLLTPLISAFADGEKTMYLCPRNDSSYTQVTDDRVILGVVTSSYSGVQKSYDIKDATLSDYESILIGSIYINGVQLKEALNSESKNAVELQFSEGVLYIKIRYKDSRGASYSNPFSVTDTTKGIRLNVVGGATIGAYTLGTGDAYYTINDGTWEELKGVKYAEPHKDTQYYETNDGKFNVVFYIRNEVGGPSFGDINLTDADMTKIMAVTEINKINYADARSQNSTVTYGLNPGIRNYFHLQFRIGENYGGNPFGIDSAESGTFRIKLTEGVVTQSGYYIAPFDYSYDFATKAFTQYVGDDEDPTDPEEPESELPYRYLVPNSATDLTYDVGDGRIALWFNIRVASDGATIGDTLTDEMLEQLKGIMQINDVTLSEAMDTDSTIVFRSLAAGQIQILFRIKESADGPAHTNPFGITADNLYKNGIKFSMTSGLELAGTYYIPKSDVLYYNFNTRVWDDKDIDPIPEGPVEIDGDYIAPRNDESLMKKLTNSKGTYYQLWFKAQAYISEQNLEDSILVNGISVSDAKAVAGDPNAIIFNMTNDVANENYYIYIQCKITDDDQSQNPFGVTGTEDIEVIFGEDLIIGNNTDFPGAKWNYSSADSVWTKDESYDVAASKVNLTLDAANTKLVDDGYFQIAFTADSKLTGESTDLLSDAQVTVNLVINNRTAYRILKGTNDKDAFKVLAEDNMLYLHFKTDGNPFNVTDKDDITIEFCPVLNINGKIVVPASFKFDSATSTWSKSDDVFSRTVITDIAAHLANEASEGTNADKYTVINVTTDKSVLENGGSGNFQAASTAAARLLREYVAFNGVTLQECFDTFDNQYAVMVWSRAEGMIFWAMRCR